MKKLLVVVLLLSAVCASAQTTAYKDQFPSVEVRGTAERKIEPNRIEVRVALSEAPSKGKTTLSALESQLAAALAAAGVAPATQLAVVGQSSALHKKTTAYQYKNYLLTLRSSEQLDAFFEALASTEIADASVGRTYHTDEAQIRQELQAEAMKNSRQTAQNLASAIGQGVGPAISIQYWSASPSPMFDGNSMLRAAKAPSEASLGSVKMRQIEFKADVTVVYELKLKP